jgi:hypothetical protein
MWWLDLVLAAAALVAVINVLAVLVLAGASRAHADSIDHGTRRQRLRRS